MLQPRKSTKQEMALAHAARSGYLEKMINIINNNLAYFKVQCCGLKVIL